MFAVGTPRVRPEPLPGSHASRDGIRAAEPSRGGRDVAALEGASDRRRRDDEPNLPRSLLDLVDDVDRKTVTARPGLGQERRAA